MPSRPRTEPGASISPEGPNPSVTCINRHDVTPRLRQIRRYSYRNPGAQEPAASVGADKNFRILKIANICHSERHAAWPGGPCTRVTICFAARKTGSPEGVRRHERMECHSTIRHGPERSPTPGRHVSNAMISPGRFSAASMMAGDARLPLLAGSTFCKAFRRRRIAKLNALDGDGCGEGVCLALLSSRERRSPRTSRPRTGKGITPDRARPSPEPTPGDGQ